VDRDATFREFVLRRGHALSRVAFLLTGDHQLAEDLVQVALARAAVRWTRIMAAGDPEPYIRRIMVNERTTWWRSRRYESVGRADCVSMIAAGHASGVDETEQVNRRLALVQALNRLTARQRAVVVLRYYVDMSVEETAQTLGCSQGTVKSTTSDALSRLRVTAADLGKVS
jgi:RNA polymerase sigma-70 factor (sigma-E family)